jgi:DNA invertase Pin-like site-specific DNA recombinase
MLDNVLLRRLYLDEQRTIRAIAELAGCSTYTVYRRLMHYRSPRRSRDQWDRHRVSRVLDALDEQTLRCLYLEEQRSIAEVASLLNCSDATIRAALIRWDIPRRPAGRAKK